MRYRLLVFLTVLGGSVTLAFSRPSGGLQLWDVGLGWDGQDIEEGVLNQDGISKKAMSLPSQAQIRGRSSIRSTLPLETAEMESSVPAPTSMPAKPSATTTWRIYCKPSRPQVGPPTR